MTHPPLTDDQAARRRALNRLGVIWPTGWTPRLIQEYATAVDDIPPDQLERAIDQLIRERTVRPQPSQIREAAHPTPKDTTTMGRQIDLDPEYQKPDADGIRPFVRDAIQRSGIVDARYRRLWLDDLTANRTALTPPEVALISDHVAGWTLEDVA